MHVFFTISDQFLCPKLTKLISLFLGLLAGNVFDWGAKEVALLMESGEGLNFSDALTFVKPRPWLVDDLDLWKERLRTKKPHKCAAIFIDNSGFDVVLGIFPFVVEMLRYVQSVPLPYFTFQELITLKICIFDPVLVKPKCV